MMYSQHGFYSSDFDSSVDENDPYCDNHFCDSYEEAYDRLFRVYRVSF